MSLSTYSIRISSPVIKTFSFVNEIIVPGFYGKVDGVCFYGLIYERSTGCIGV